MEFCWKNSLFKTPIYYTTLSNTSSSLEDLNRRSLQISCIVPGLVDFSPWSNTIERYEDHILWIDDFDELLQVNEDSLVDLLKGERFYFVPQETVALLKSLRKNLL